MSNDFFSSYLQYVSGGEAPIAAHRWSALTALGALLERNIFLTHGHGLIHPNLYCMIIGESASRKSSAIKLPKNLLIAAGYKTLSAEKTSKEKYLADLAAHTEDGQDILDRNLFGDVDESAVTPSFVVADEANDFFGINNVEFLSILGSLWDWSGKYENRIKTGKSDFIPNPTISILAGNTQTGFSAAFPPTIFGQGFFSRLLLVYVEPTGRKVTFPKTPDPAEKAAMVQLLQMIKMQAIGERTYTPLAMKLIDKIYKSPCKIPDPRFASYYNRRLTHLLKLCLIVSAARMENQITETCVVQANTYLSYAEGLMPKALGEFGKAKDADIAQKVLSVIYGSDKAWSLLELWKFVSSDLNSVQDLGNIVRNLLAADKIQSTPVGFLPNRIQIDVEAEDESGVVDYKEFLTQEELEVKR